MRMINDMSVQKVQKGSGVQEVQGFRRFRGSGGSKVQVMNP
jgi:hypothetical protein